MRLVKRSAARFAAGLAAFTLGASLPVTGRCSEPDALHVAPTVTTAEALLSGVSPVKSDFYATIDFRLTQNTILLNARLGSRLPEDTFVLDSGAPMTIAPELAHELGLVSLASVSLAGPESNERVVPVTRIPLTTIASLAFRDVGAVVDWVEPPAELACLSMAGLIGASLLQAGIWQIDFQTSRVTISDSLSRLEGLKDAMKLAFKRADAAGSPRISVGVSELDDVSLLVDLGFNGSLAIPTALLERSGDRIAPTDPVEVGQSSSTILADAPSEVHITEIRELRLGDLRLKGFPVVTGTAVSDFHVGIEFLRHFRVTIDWLKNDLYLERRAPQESLYSDFPSYGFAPQFREGGVTVGAIWREGAAAKAGLKLGDRLVEIDGKATATSDFSGFCTLLNAVGLFGEKNDPISVTRLRHGKRETLRIARTPLRPVGPTAE